MSDAETESAVTEDETTAEAPASAAAPQTDEVLLGAVDLARAALTEITPADTIGELVGHQAIEDHVLSLHFACTMAGYPGWHWTVSLSRIDENAEPFVLETELTPGEDALLAPDWVPWSERLADYRAAQELAAAQAADAAESHDDDDDDDDLDEDDLDDDDVDELDDLDDEVDEDDLDGDHGDDVLDGIDFAEPDDEHDEHDEHDEQDEHDQSR